MMLCPRMSGLFIVLPFRVPTRFDIQASLVDDLSSNMFYNSLSKISRADLQPNTTKYLSRKTRKINSNIIVAKSSIFISQCYGKSNHPKMRHKIG